MSTLAKDAPDRGRRLIWGFVFILMFTSYPYVFDRFIPIPSYTLICAIILIAFVFFLLKKSYRNSLSSWFTFCILLQIITWSFYFLIHNDTSYLTRNFFIVLAYLTFLTLHNYGGLIRFVRINSIWISIQAVLGLVAFILVIAGLLTPLLTSENIDGRSVYFFGITCTNTYLGNIIRPAGFFDEPGALAFWGIYALIFNTLFFKNRKIEWTLVIGLLSTLSLAYFIQIALFFLFFKLKNLRTSFFFLGFVGIIVFAIYSQGQDTEIYKLTFQRVENNLAYGTNRDYMTEIAKKVYHEHPVLGVGGRNMEKHEYMADNPYEILAKDGIVGTIATYLPFIFMLFLCKKRDFLLAMVVLMIGYLQRPFHVEFLHYFMFYSFFLLSLYATRNKEAEKPS